MTTAEPAGHARPTFVVAVGACAILAAVVATLWPLFVYTVSLATLGLAHVLTELRYVDARFGRRLPDRFWLAVGALLVVLVGLRGITLGGWLPAGALAPTELLLLSVVLVTAAGPLAAAARQSTRQPGAVAALVATVALVSVVVYGAMRGPLELLVLFAVLHNATPLLFLVERAPPGRRRLAAVATTALFVGVPALVAAGATTTLLSEAIDLHARPWRTGSLVEHYVAYLPPALRGDPRAAQLFSAAVTAQLLHYGAVIVWLPRTLGADERPRLPWPRSPVFAVVVVALSAGLLAHFVVDFVGARALYGLAAAVHAWLEWPVLLAALGGLGADDVGDVRDGGRDAGAPAAR